MFLIKRKVLAISIPSLLIGGLILLICTGRSTITIGAPVPIETNGRSDTVDILKTDPQKIGCMVLINASVDEKPGIFLVDTGSGDTVLDVNFAKKNGFVATKKSWLESFIALFFKTNIEHEIKRGKVGTLRIGNAEFEKLNVSIIDVSHFSPKLEPPLAGVIGMDVWRVSGLRIDLGKHQLTVLPPVPTSKDVKTARFTMEHENIFASSNMYTNVEINRNVFHMLIDTGASVTSLGVNGWKSLEAIASSKAGSETRIRNDWNRSGPAKIDFLPGNHLKWGDLMQSDVTLVKYEPKNYVNLNILGMDVLGSHVVTILPYLRRIYFEYP